MSDENEYECAAFGRRDAVAYSFSFFILILHHMQCDVLPTVIDLLALVRCHPLYILLRVRRELCFW